MIPNIQIPPLRIFGTEFTLFGALLMAAFLVGAHLAARAAERSGRSAVAMYDGALLAVVFGFLGAHSFHILAYEPRALARDPWALLKIWTGLSSFGGLLGAGGAIWFYLRRKGLPVLEYGDLLMLGLVPGFAIGRLGCFTAHDHLGRESNFVLAVRFTQGARHDLGLYEALLLGILSAILYIAWRRTSYRPTGKLYAFTLLFYGLARGCLDFLRSTDLPNSDVRYAGLTPAQYLSVGFVALGLGLGWRLRRKGDERVVSS